MMRTSESGRERQRSSLRIGPRNRHSGHRRRKHPGVRLGHSALFQANHRLGPLALPGVHIGLHHVTVRRRYCCDRGTAVLCRNRVPRRSRGDFVRRRKWQRGGCDSGCGRRETMCGFRDNRRRYHRLARNHRNRWFGFGSRSRRFWRGWRRLDGSTDRGQERMKRIDVRLPHVDSYSHNRNESQCQY